MTLAPPDIAHELSVLNEIDLAIACEYLPILYGKLVPCDNEAEWIVWTAPSPCGCHGILTRFFCSPCLDIRNTGRIRCSECHQKFDPPEYRPYHFERISSKGNTP